MSLGKRQAKELWDRLFGKGSPTTPAGVVWAAAFIGDPGEDGQSGTEVSGGSYARVSMAATDFVAATDAVPAVILTSSDVDFPTATADWADGSPDTITHIALFNHATATAEANYIGSALIVDALGGSANPQIVLNSDDFSVPSGTLSFDIAQTGESMGKRAAGELLNWVFGKTPANTPAGVLYLAAFVGDPGADGQSGTEVSGGSYARVATSAASWNTATSADPSVVTNAAALTFPQATASWGNVSHLALFDHATNTGEANFVARFTITGGAKPVGINAILNVGIGQLSSSID